MIKITKNLKSFYKLKIYKIKMKVLYKNYKENIVVGTLISSYEDEIVVQHNNNIEFVPYANILEKSSSERKLKEVLKEKFSNLVFRKVIRIFAFDQKGIKSLLNNEKGEIYYDNTELCETTIYKFQKFHGFAQSCEKDEVNYFNDKVECDFNEWGNLISLPFYKKGIPPVKNSIICGIPSSKYLSDKYCPFKKWFKCSEQFLEFHYCLMNDFIPKNITSFFYKLETNISKLYLESISEKFTKNIDFNIGYDKNMTKNETTEIFSQISHFYQFLFKDCFNLNTEFNITEMEKSIYYKNHRLLYLLFKKRILWMNDTTDLNDKEYKFLPTIVC